MNPAWEELGERFLMFSVRGCRLVDALPETRVARHVAGQLVRCCTSPGPNYREACAAESPRDFIHKLGVVLKELNETDFWLRFIIAAGLLPEKRVAELLDECKQLANIVAQSILTARKRASKGSRKRTDRSKDE